MQQKRLLWDMYVCVLGGGIWKGIHSMKTEGITYKIRQSYLYMGTQRMPSVRYA